MEDTERDLYLLLRLAATACCYGLLLWLDNLLIFDLYNYDKNRRNDRMRKAKRKTEEALDGSLSMLMTIAEDRLW